jgi:DNA-binding response OmpR family regulator
VVRKEAIMSSQRAGILVVDDELSVTDLLSTTLEEEGYSCVTATTGEEALKKLSMSNVDVVLLDLRLPGISGMDVLQVIKSTYPRTAVIVVTAMGDAETAVEAMKTGAVDYITKPFEVERVSQSIEAALQATAIWNDKSVPQTGDVGMGDEEVDWTRYLDDIAGGVGTRLDSLTAHVMTIAVVERTIDIARNMGIPEGQVRNWADTRLKHIERINIRGSLLEKVEKIPVA